MGAFKNFSIFVILKTEADYVQILIEPFSETQYYRQGFQNCSNNPVFDQEYPIRKATAQIEIQK